MVGPSKRPILKSAGNNAPVSKRARGDQESREKGTFETKLEELVHNDDGLYRPSSSANTPGERRSSRQQGAEEKWPRPKPDNIFSSSSPMCPIPFQLIDLDYYMDKNKLVIRLFGVTKNGNSICVNVYGYRPYLYASAPQCFGREHIEPAIKILESDLKASSHAISGLSPDASSYVTDMEICFGSSLYGFIQGKTSQFLKIFLLSPKLITPCKNLLSRLENIVQSGDRFSIRPFESNIDFEVRFMSDLELVGCGWAECPAGQYMMVTRRQTSCQLEIDMNVENLVVHSSSLIEWSGIAPIRTLSFDIECLGRSGIFPEASQDPIIQIANMVKIEGQQEPFIRNCFVTGTSMPIIGSDVIECHDEKELLTRWARFVKTVDPDLLTGYNIQNFDLPYIMDRAKHLKIENQVCFLTRVLSNQCKQRDAFSQSKQMGNRVNRHISMEGRIIFDVLQLILRDYKLRSYTLNSVSYHFLNEQKEDVSPNVIPDLQRGEPKDRRRLALYCMKDAYLPIRLLEKLMLVINYIEMARVTGVPINFLVSRGQQVKILSMLLRKTRAKSFYLPVYESDGSFGDDGVGYEGATVIEPKRAFYNEPIATLDFASLYPSIMIAHNLCYTTFIKKPPQGMVEGEDYTRTPSGDLFVTSKHCKGLLPQILEELLTARKKAKFDLKKETDPFRQMVLNGRQLALKISANSVYGFTGASRGKLPCTEISQSVTAFGRQMIEDTKNAVEANYKMGAVDGRCINNAIVVYGDTDSVMVRFGVQTVAEAMVLGQHAAEHVSKQFLPPIKLEFEKVYYPYLLINKKRYAGLYWTNEKHHDKLDCKGLETVRRDNCPLVASVLNTCLEKLMVDRNPETALTYAKRIISDLLCGRVDISMLIITKELTKRGDKYAAKQAHVELAERMRKRDPGSAPRLGDRVPYVIINKGKNVPAYEKAEDPIYVLKNGIPLDLEHYLEHQLVKPLARIFEPILGDKAENQLMRGEHTKKKVAAKSKVGGLYEFAVKKSKCLGCYSLLEGDYEAEDQAPPTCNHCLPQIGKIYARKITGLKATEHRFGRLWTECQNCAGYLQDEVLCSARDCPIFYMREKVRTDLDEQTRALRRFTLDNN